MAAYFVATFFVTAFFGVGFVFIPGPLLGIFGVSLDAIGVTLARMFGTALLAFPVLTWSARRSASLDF